MTPLHRLRCGLWSAEVAADIGGALASFWSVDASGAPRHWMRPADAAALTAGDAFCMASFPLVPWCNRIRDGRFAWQGRAVQVAGNRRGAAHALHGLGWQRPWTVERADELSIDLTLDDAGQGAWPFPYQARQRYALDDRGLEIRLELVNTGPTRLPAGIGHHPYFPHRRGGAGTRVTAEVEGLWLSDADLLPVALSTTDPAVGALARGMRLSDCVLDNNFTGYRRRAHIAWPDGSGLRIVASAPLDFLVLYSPAVEPVFVLEAVSNCTDWMNLLDRGVVGARPETVGGSALEPGASLVATTRFEPEMPPLQNRK